LGELGLAGERVGRGMRADEEISGDIADMMANSQAASKSPLLEGFGLTERYTCLCGFTGTITCLLPIPDYSDTTATR